MTSIIIAALGVAGCAFFWRNWRISEGRRRIDQCHFRRAINEAADEIARLTPLAEIGERRVQAYRKYKAKHRKGNGDA